MQRVGRRRDLHQVELRIDEDDLDVVRARYRRRVGGACEPDDRARLLGGEVHAELPAPVGAHPAHRDVEPSRRRDLDEREELSGVALHALRGAEVPLRCGGVHRERARDEDGRHQPPSPGHPSLLHAVS